MGAGGSCLRIDMNEMVSLAIATRDEHHDLHGQPDPEQQAKADDRRVFLFFTGSDWCSWCKRLNREILSTPEFQKFAGEKLVLVELDFPKSKAQPAPVKEQNAKLAQQFKIEGYPTVIVLDSSGKKVGELGYQEGGAGPFIDAISKM